MTNKEYQAALRKLAKAIEKEFLAAVYNKTGKLSVAEIIAAIESGNADAVADLVSLVPADLTQIIEKMRQGYVQSGVAEAVLLKHSLDVTNPRAVKWLAEQSSSLVVDITKGQRDSVKIALAQGMSLGQNSRTVALDLVGRINNITKRREGGIVGLYPQQVEYVNNARAELLELNPNYLTRKARDRRFDKLYETAIKDKKPLTDQQVGAITARYSDRLLKVRGDTIGRTEAHEAIASGEEEARQQALYDGVIDIKHSYKIWDAAADARTRPDHAAMNGQKRKLNEPFITPDGYRLMHPMDTSLGAPASKTINCRCRARTKIDYIGMQADRERINGYNNNR